MTGRDPQPDAAEALEALTRAALRHARAVGRTESTRRERDEAIRGAAAAGLGVREIARAAGMDPSQASRIIRADR